MSTTTPDELARQAMQALHAEDPRRARELLLDAVRSAPERADLMHALGSVHLQLGEPELGKPLLEQGLTQLDETLARAPERREELDELRAGYLLAIGAACEDLDLPAQAVAAYERVVREHAGHPRARQSLAYLHLACGNLDLGRQQLAVYLADGRDDDDFLAGAQAFAECLAKWTAADVHPRELLAAHRGSYVQMFDHYAAEQAKQGWVAEAARMKRVNGALVASVPEGARPYAAVRVDLVDPSTGQVGQVGDQPMVVAIGGYEPLAQTPVLFTWPEQPFPVRVSTQAPWDQLPVQVRMVRGSDLDALDAVMGDWYRQGFDGSFGTPDGQRFHYVSDPEIRRNGTAAVYHLDLGRARDEAIDALLRRLAVLHGTHPVAEVVLGRGYLGGEGR